MYIVEDTIWNSELLRYKFMKVLFVVFLFSIIGISCSDTVAQNSDIVGSTTPAEVREQHPVFDIYTKRYEPDMASIEYLSAIEDSVQIYVLFGTWCHDSKKQIPAFMKIMELTNNPAIMVQYTAVTRKKTDPEQISEYWGLKYTPTFIIYREGKEFGRIIEEPRVSVEEDLVSILESGSPTEG